MLIEQQCFRLTPWNCIYSYTMLSLITHNLRASKFKGGMSSNGMSISILYKRDLSLH